MQHYYNGAMSVRNNTKKSDLVDRVRVAKSFKQKTLGLLLFDEPQTLLIKTRFGIHTFGMKYAIDVIVLDKDYRVVKAKSSLAPNRIFLWNPKYDTVLELPEQIIERTHTTVGDQLQIEEQK